MSLSVVAPGFLIVLGVLAAGLWVGYRSARRRRRAAAVAVLVAALVASTASAADGVNAYFGYLPRVGDVIGTVEETVPAYPVAAGHRPHGLIVRLAVPDRGSGFGPGEALVYLPPQYFTYPSRRFPVVYLVHGSPGVPADWFRGGEAADAAAAVAAAGHPVLVIAPRMSHGWLDDPECVDGLHERVETHLLRDVLPAVDGHLRTVAGRTGRTLGGMSAGGYCALNMGLRHRDLFGSIIDMSGEVAPTHTGGMVRLFGTDTAAARANTPGTYAAHLSPVPQIRIWFDCGSGDTALLAGIRTVAAVLAGRGFAVEVHVRPGAHTFRVWRPALREALPWAAQAGP